MCKVSAGWGKIEMKRFPRSLHVNRLLFTHRTLSSTTPKASKYEGVGLLGLCEDRNSSYLRGTASAPTKILEELRCDSSNSYSELGMDTEGYIEHLGDWHPGRADAQSISGPLSALLQYTHTQRRLPLLLGGDHSLSFPIVQALRRVHGQSLVIVHFDAHPDLYPLFADNPSSHASPFARILEQREPQLCRQLIQIGIRTINDVQRKQIEKYSVRTIEARQFPAHGSEVGKMIAEHIPSPDTPVYLSFDMDAIDPAFAPGVSHRESGGLSVRQAVDAIHSIPGRIVGADLVEFNPDRDINGLTASVAAKLVKEITGKILRSNEIA